VAHHATLRTARAGLALLALAGDALCGVGQQFLIAPWNSCET
jgi:hypothetical protein